MAYLGLVPSEHSSGETIRRGGITKTGNGHARRVLVEGAWTYKHHARVTLPVIKRQRELSKKYLPDFMEGTIKTLSPLQKDGCQEEAE